MTQNPDPDTVPSGRRARVIDALKALTSLPAKTVLYGSALLAVAAIPGAELTGPLAVLAGGLGVEALGSILDRLVNGENVSAEEIQQAVNKAIAESGIADLLTTDEFQASLGRLLHQQHLIRAAVEHSEYKLIDELTSQYSDYQALLFELQGDLIVVQNQLPTLATREQGEAILQAIETLAQRLTSIPLPDTVPAPTPGRPQLTVLRLFLASPGDVQEERNRVRQVVAEFNQPGALAEQHNVTIQLLAWEDAVAGMGRPEDVILDQMPVTRWDIFIGVLWTRFGSPTGGRDPDTGLPYDGGTEEEFKLAYRAWKQTGKPHILFYRRTAPPASLDDLDLDQFGKVRAFFGQFKSDGRHQGLFGGYSTEEEFERRVRQDLTKLLPRLTPAPLPAQKPPAFGVPRSPALDHSALERPFLEWLERTHSRLELRGLRMQGQLPVVAMDRIYVALKGGQSSPDERADSRALIDAEMEELDAQLGWDAPEWRDKRLRRWKVLTYSPIHKCQLKPI